MKFKLLFVLIIFISISYIRISQDAKEIKVHFIGNSYTYYQNLPQVLAAMTKKKGVPMVTPEYAYGGLNCVALSTTSQSSACLYPFGY